ncbi:MAG: serine hydrolase [Pseudonocardiaceae bacterium]
MWRPVRISTMALLVASAALAIAAVPAATAPAVPNWPPDLPADGSVSFTVVDRDTGEIRAEHDVHAQYRSASLVKLLIALDYFETRGPDVEIPPEDRTLLESMLRSSDDQAASILWVREGWQLIVERMVDRLGLTDTEPPADRRIWGYTATSAADVARIYEYLLAEAAPSAREFILGALREATHCAADGRDQYFGIPSAVDEPWAVKQGWSGYGDVEPGQECAEPTPARSDGEQATPESSPAVRDAAIRAQSAEGPDIDLTRPAMHTSGTIGAADDTIMVVLSLHAEGTSYEDSAERLTAITRVLYGANCPSCAS